MQRSAELTPWCVHDSFVRFVEALDDVGEHIKKAGVSYELAHKRLVSGRGNLVGRTQNLKTLGAKVKKAIKNDLLEAAAENDEGLTMLLNETLAEEVVSTVSQETSVGCSAV